MSLRVDSYCCAKVCGNFNLLESHRAPDGMAPSGNSFSRTQESRRGKCGETIRSLPSKMTL